VCASAVVILDTPYSEVVGRVLATHSIRQFSHHFPPVRRRVPSHFSWSLPPTEFTYDLNVGSLIADVYLFLRFLFTEMPNHHFTNFDSFRKESRQHSTCYTTPPNASSLTAPMMLPVCSAATMIPPPRHSQ
jgi:hypothetical protein